MPKKVCPTCNKIVEYNHVCPNKSKDTRKKEINTDSRWRKIRQEVRQRDLCCVLCFLEGQFSNGRDCHHVVPREVCDDDQVFDPNNVVYLCQECHQAVHRDGWQKYKELFENYIKEKNSEN